jgi:hypothetical protein
MWMLILVINGYIDVLFQISGIMRYEFVPSGQSTRHAVFKFCSVYGSTFIDR